MFKTIKEFPHLEINESGVVRDIKTKKERSFESKEGYKRLRVIRDKISHSRSLHKLIYETFVKEVPKGYVVDHIDNDKTNNHLDNLQLLTRRMNSSKQKGKINCEDSYLVKRKDSDHYRVRIRYNGKRHAFNIKDYNIAKKYSDELKLCVTDADIIKILDKLKKHNNKVEKSCEWCSSTYESNQPQSKYCSKECVNKAKNKRKRDRRA